MLFFTYFIFLFTDFVVDIRIRYKLGFWFICLIGFIFLFNLSLISASMYNDALFDNKKNKAVEAWKNFEELKVKMAEFLVNEANQKAVRMYGTERAAKKNKLTIDQQTD